MKVDINGREHNVPIWVFVPLLIVAGYLFFKSAMVKTVYNEPIGCEMMKNLGSHTDDHHDREYRQDRYERATYDLGGNTLYMRDDGLVVTYLAFRC